MVPATNVHAIPPGVELVDARTVASRPGRALRSEARRSHARTAAGCCRRRDRRGARAPPGAGDGHTRVPGRRDLGCQAVDVATGDRARLVGVERAPLDDELERYPLTIDATGTAEGLAAAVALTAAEGTVVLLGSPRAETSALPVRAMQERGIRVVGAHIGTLKRVRLRTSAGLEEELTDNFFRLLAEGVSFSDLIERHSPAEAADVYEVAAQQPSFVAAAFDWSGERLEPTSICQNLFPWLTRPFASRSSGAATSALETPRRCEEAQGARLTRIFDPIAALAQDQLAKKHAPPPWTRSPLRSTSPDVDAVLDRHAARHSRGDRSRGARGRQARSRWRSRWRRTSTGAMRITRMAEASDQAVAVLFSAAKRSTVPARGRGDRIRRRTAGPAEPRAPI